MDIIFDNVVRLDSRHFVVRRMDGANPKYGGHLTRYPQEVLAIRAAELNLPKEDPRVLDIVSFEVFMDESDMPDGHPLYRCDTVEEVVAELMGHVDRLKKIHNAPPGKAGVLFHAAETPIASKGLVDTRAVLLEHGDMEIAPHVRKNRDEIRSMHKEARKVSAPPAMLDILKERDATRQVRQEERESYLTRTRALQDRFNSQGIST